MWHLLMGRDITFLSIILENRCRKEERKNFKKTIIPTIIYDYG